MDLGKLMSDVSLAYTMMRAKEMSTPPTDTPREKLFMGGISMDPGGATFCRRCGHSVSICDDNCTNCALPLDWMV